MGLVDYGSESEDEAAPISIEPAKSPPPPGSLFAALPTPKGGRLERKKIIIHAPETREDPDISTDMREGEASLTDPHKVACNAGSLAALLPPPKARPVRETTRDSGNGSSVMARGDAEVAIRGSNTAFTPKHIPKVSSKTPASKSATPRASLFSVPVTMGRTSVEEGEGTYVPLLATESRPRADPHAHPADAGLHGLESGEQEARHPSEAFRYDERVDYGALMTHDEDTTTTTTQERRTKRQRREAAPMHMQEYDAAHEYALNQAYIESGAAEESAPVRFVGTGKHQLSSLLNLANSQKDALEESFAHQKRAMKDAKSKYGR